MEITAPELARRIEALLFLAARPLRIRKIAEILGVEIARTHSAIEEFRTAWNARNGGTVVAVLGEEVQLLTHADCAAVAEAFAQAEVRGELTRPQLEALTVIAYRGPITKAELEHIRGVHCGVIIRNLLLRGLIEQRMDAQRHEEVYTISMEFLRHLGLPDLQALPEYERLHGHLVIDQYLATVRTPDAPTTEAPSV
ncbi:SMC-Scp complex subunit ScpB [Candidatus Uhrbacteria bacterium]|nr:SMC-Scp complex subunit ScpB [Candidatus Uhrbacteria bacterium]